MAKPLKKTSARGYGWEHQKHRRVVESLVLSGKATCARCGEPIGRFEKWDLDHAPGRQNYNGPAHVACNRATAKREMPPDDPANHRWYGPDGEVWSRPWEVWR